MALITTGASWMKGSPVCVSSKVHIQSERAESQTKLLHVLLNRQCGMMSNLSATEKKSLVREASAHQRLENSETGGVFLHS